MGDIGKHFKKEFIPDGSACTVCEGSGYDPNPDTFEDCEHCNGTGDEPNLQESEK